MGTALPGRETNSLPAARSRFLEAWLEEGDAGDPDGDCKVQADPGVRVPWLDRRVRVGWSGWRGETDPWLDRRDDVEVSEDAARIGGEPPENALQGLQGRVLSEHELRVQRSLQQLNVPDWYKNSSRPSEGFLLKRGSDATSVAGRRGAGGWPGLGVKTTSLSSLRSPTTAVRLGSSPSPPPAAFTRWSSSRLHSAGSAGSASATPSTSPCGSARSSFNHRQPYLGWRSQERLSGTPRTPAERLAQGLLEQREHQRQQERLRGSSQLQSSSPNLSDVRSSIKEVTSAIVHYVSAANDPGSNTDVRLAGRSPAPSSATTTATGTARDREDHPRSHSNQRVCWIESSFVGSRPLEQPQTPEEGSVSTSPLPMHHQDLYLDLKQRSQRSSTCATGAAGSLPSNGPTTVPGPHQSHASPDEIDMHHDSDSSEHNLKRTPSKRDTAFIRKRNQRALKKKKGSKTWKTKSKLKVVSLELFFGIGVCML